MPISRVYNATIKGICCALPKNNQHIEQLGSAYFETEYIKKVSQIIGIKRLYHVTQHQTTSDLCYAAAEKLISKLEWTRKSIDAILFVSQTPDYITPSTGCILQNRLGLSKDCIALDINLGCSGYIYGIWLASQFIYNKACKRVLVLVGDTLSKLISEKDKSTVLIFGDAGSATALECIDGQNPSTFILKSDGSGANNLIVPAGGFRNPYDEKTKKMIEDDDGNTRSQEHIYMNGMEILGFAVREVPKILKEVIKSHGWHIENVDRFLLHQANNYMLKFIAQKTKIPIEKIPLNLDKFGNTSGATIPLLICDKLKEDLKERSMNVIMSGFGVGLSWGAAAMNLSNIHCLEIIYV
ncbi:MAG: ketoacyl-ACP synthase III [Marinisporobacter sp.]|nr:ketoacyl-ACP synthase III [Marinisporobacter sp.]